MTGTSTNIEMEHIKQFNLSTNLAQIGTTSNQTNQVAIAYHWLTIKVVSFLFDASEIHWSPPSDSLGLYTEYFDQRFPAQKISKN